MAASRGRIEDLREVPLFAVLDDEQLARVAEEGDVARAARGEVYAREGEPVGCFSAVLEGELRIFKRVDGRKEGSRPGN